MFLGEVGVEIVGLRLIYRREAVKEMSGSATKVWKLSSMKKTFILVNEECLRMYVPDALGSVQNRYVGGVLDDRNDSLLGVSTQSYNGYLVHEYERGQK